MDNYWMNPVESTGHNITDSNHISSIISSLTILSYLNWTRISIDGIENKFVKLRQNQYNIQYYRE